MNELRKKLKTEKYTIKILQFTIGISFILIWELLSRFNIINSFIFSSPTKIVKTIIDLYLENKLLTNIYVTLMELFISFGLGSIIGFVIALIFYRFNIII